MSLELNLSFATSESVIVRYDDDTTDALPFKNPITDEDRQDIRWYLETYAASYTTDVDDEHAARIETRLPEWGEKLFDAVFTKRSAQRLFNYFQEEDQAGRLLTISSGHPEILSLPWELLRDPEGTFLVNEDPRISIRRNLSKAGGGRKSFKIRAKDRLHLLFVVSRPKDAPFISPRSDPRAVMDALAQHAPGRADVEFLRPATLQNLVDRLEDEDKPRVDILHFDGHGAYDPDGRLAEEADKVAVPGGMAGMVRKGDAADMGYLLFEDEDGKKAMISADMLGEMLNRKKIGLVVLSACQSAKVGGDDAMGSVSARLTHAGIPAVLAMTHSVLVHTTRRLFGAFYRHLAMGKNTGTALDNARRELFMHPERGERQRGEHGRITLKLQDWFLPALYQAGRDVPLLEKNPPRLSSAKGENPPRPPFTKGGSNLPELQEAGFFGRTRELWDIERAFVRGTRRVTVTGFGGQGKTYLAIEAGNWLVRTGMFDWACFVDYAKYQGVDPVSMAVTTLGTVLDENLLDTDAAAKALEQRPVLMILDNLESLSEDARGELLDAVRIWSEAGDSRALLTTRQPDFGHEAYPKAGSIRHVYLNLRRLSAEDALQYFQAMMKLPPKPELAPPERRALLNLFQQVDFHPLSVGLLASQLKFRRPAELGERLEALLAETPEDTPDKSLMASLNLSLDRLDKEAREWLPRLGVFQGGAMEPVLLEITEFSEDQWEKLRQALETTGLIQPEHLPGVSVPYLRFHPTLAPALWSRVPPEERKRLSDRYRQRYYQLSKYLYFEDRKNPHQTHAIARRELSNLLCAVCASLNASEEWAVEFAGTVNKFLGHFGLNREREKLIREAEACAGKAGSRAWFLSRSSAGEQLLMAGRYQEAERVCQEILTELDREPSYERCLTLTRLGRCFHFQGKTDQAAASYRQGLAVAEELESSQDVKWLMGAMQTDLADSLRDMGDYEGARTAYEKSLVIIKEINGDERNEARTKFQLGVLAMLQGNLQEAIQRYHDALTTFRHLNEPAVEAVVWHQLGSVYDEVEQKDAAEGAYREAARINENLGNLAEVAQTWNSLALLTESAGKPDEAEGWYRKAIDANRKLGIAKNLAKDLSNLANLLQNQPDRLQEARQLAEEALAIKQTLDPAMAEIWTIYAILADIADQQKEPEQAEAYRRQSREAYAGFMGAQHQVRQHGQWIAAVVIAVHGNTEAREAVQQYQEAMRKGGESWERVADTLDRIIAGERDEEVLCDPLDYEGSMIIHTILQGIANPESLETLL